MSGFSEMILFLVSFYATVTFFRMFIESKRLFHFYIGTSVIFVAIIGASGFMAKLFPILEPEFIDQWSLIFAISFIMSAAATQIRDSKPVFTRFPRVLTMFPLFLILFYPFIIDTLVIKVWILLLYQGGAIAIALLIYGYKTYRDPLYGYLLVGVLFFLLTFVLYWQPSDQLEPPEYIWPLMVSSSMLVCTAGYKKIYNNGSEELLIGVSNEEWFI